MVDQVRLGWYAARGLHLVKMQLTILNPLLLVDHKWLAELPARG